jgi:hypothetical protein
MSTALLTLAMTGRDCRRELSNHGVVDAAGRHERGEQGHVCGHAERRRDIKIGAEPAHEPLGLRYPHDDGTLGRLHGPSIKGVPASGCTGAPGAPGSGLRSDIRV